MSGPGNGSGATTLDGASAIKWERDADAIARVTDPNLHPVLVAALERDTLLESQLAGVRGEVRIFRGEADERYGAIIGALGRIEGLAAGTAARVARLDGEREVTRQEVKDVHRWAEELKRDADASNQGKVLSMREATEALAKLGEARIGQGVAEAQRDIGRAALQSFSAETTIIRTERRTRPWRVTALLVAALLGPVATGVAVWWVTRPAVPVPALVAPAKEK